ncbi:MAG: single-stranded-DNA-specific exonuclease RecJ [Clostridiales bacterium]|nr:single-stranded-DNA-specific exonuclease RecJ [Clostridiales bacterium]
MIIYSPSKYYTPEIEADRSAAFHPIVMRALRARGILTDEERKRFMFPDLSMLRDPFGLPDMQKAVDRIEEAVMNGENICVYGDYDVDGICATTILLHYLLSIGAEASYRIPSRHDEGYGISRRAIDAMKESGVSLIITVDNGISAHNEIAYAGELGIDVIVTDHHIPPEELPECTAVICHSVPGCEYPGYLCGAGTALKLIQAMGGVEAAKDYIFLAGVATVADVVPLLDENRLLVKYALDSLNKGECCLGMRMLLDSLPSARKPYSVFNIGFGIAPRLNASGRMGDASLGVELFMTEDEDEAARIIAELNRLNEQRQAEEQGILDEAVEMVEKLDISDKHAILLASDKWNSGVIGIAASRLTEMYHRPTILFSEHDGALKGSARSVEGINIHDALKANSDMFIRFGGHAKAAGVTMEKEMFPQFVERMEKYFAETCAPDLFVPRRCYEFDEDLGNITMELTKELEMLAPFGEGNPCPVFHISNVSPYHIRRFGCDGQHLRMDLRQNRFCFESVYFCGGRCFENIMRADSISLLYSPFINNWNGSENLQMRVLSVRPDLPRCASRYIKSNISNFYMAYLSGACLEKSDKPLPDVTATSVSEAIRTSFAGLAVLVFSTDGAETTLRELAADNVENFEVCFGTVPDGVFSGNMLLIAPNADKLPKTGYNRFLFADEPYSTGVYDRLREVCPNANITRLGRENDFSDICSGFSISRDEMSLYYKTTANLLASSTLSMTELVAKLCDALNRPVHQTIFVLKTFVELEFITDDGGKAVRMLKSAPRKLAESAIYSLVAGSQR